jgi:DNA-binding IclR family transcriptional regulator
LTKTEGATEQRVEAVERALSILEAFSDGRQKMPLGELAERTGLYRSTILRLAASLERFGYLHRDTDGQFRLGPTLLRLGVLYRSAFDLSDYVRPILQQTAEETGETSCFYIRDGGRRICLYRASAPRTVRSHVEEGAELPLDRGASAHILVAFTDGTEEFHEAIRSRGFYISHGERDPETKAVAVPVFGPDKKLVGSLGVTGPKNRFDEANCERFVEILTAKAQILSRTLSGHPHQSN